MRLVSNNSCPAITQDEQRIAAIKRPKQVAYGKGLLSPEMAASLLLPTAIEPVREGAAAAISRCWLKLV